MPLRLILFDRGYMRIPMKSISPFFVRQPSCARLLLTTALIGLAPLMLAPMPALSQQMYLDNVDKTNSTVDPGDGSWEASSEIWSDSLGENHAALPQGGTGVLKAADASTQITLTVVGVVRPGELQVVEGDFTLTGGQIGTIADVWTLNVEAGKELKVGSTLGGTLTIAGDGSVHFSGSESDMQQLTIESGATFKSDGTTAGAMIVEGTAQLDGQHNGGVSVDVTGKLSGSGTIDETLINHGEVTVDTGHALTVTDAAGTVNSAALNVMGSLTSNVDNEATGVVSLSGSGLVAGNFDNKGTLKGNGTIDGQLENASGGTIEITTGQLLTVKTGVLTNTGKVSVSGALDVADGGLKNNIGGQLVLDRGAINGTVEALSGSEILIASSSRIDGDLNNAGTLEMTGASNARLDLTGHTLTHSGEIKKTGAGRLRIAADDLIFEGAAVVDTSIVALNGRITNRATLNVAGDLVLTDDLINDVGGSTTVSSRLNAAGFNIINNGSFDVLSGGYIRHVEKLTNTADLKIQTGATVSASNIDNSGDLMLGGSLTGELENSGAVTLSGGKLTGNLKNDGTVSGTGTITGKLDNNATAEIAGTVGSIDNSGTLTTTGDLVVAGVLTNTATATVSAGDRLTAAGTTNRGALNIDGTLASDVSNRTGGVVTLATTGRLEGNTVNTGGIVLLQGGGITGNLTNETAGTVRITADTAVAGDVINRGALDMVGATHDLRLSLTNGTFTNAGTITESGGHDLTIAADSIVLTAASDVTDIDLIGDIQNSGRLTYTENTALGGSLTNLNGGVLNVLTSLDFKGNPLTNRGAVNVGSASSVGSLTDVGRLENGGALIVHLGSSAQAASAFNLDGGEMTIAGNLTVPLLENRSGGTVGLNGQLVGDLSNAGNLTGTGVVTGAVSSSGQMDWSGKIGGDLTSTGTAALAGAVGGALRNEGVATTKADLTVEGRVVNSGAGASLSVAASTILTARSGLLGENGAALRNAGRIVGDLDSRGTYYQTGVLHGALDTHGVTRLGGQVTGNVNLLNGTLDALDGLNIGGALSLNQNFKVESDRSITAAATKIADKAALILAGTLNSEVSNDGVIAVQGGTGTIRGELVNDGVVALTGNGQAADALTVKGLSGTGEYQLDVNLAQMKSDQIVVSGGAAQGHMSLVLNGLDLQNALTDSRVTLVKVDRSFDTSNTFKYDYAANFSTSERIVYSVEQAGKNGNIDLIAQTNPAIGSIFGNVALTQSLIGSVVNRPTSPFVTGLAAQVDEKPCGAGAWARVTGGNAKASGATDNGISKVNSTVDADYAGVQFGGDMACFDGRHGGWNTAFGIIGGQNIGKTSQPIYAIDGRNSQQAGAQVSSINKTDFTQTYGGVYMTGTKGNWMVDLQLRHEDTRFTMTNAPVSGLGLGLKDAKFNSKANTLSGAVSYNIPMGEDSSWALIPTAGFAWSRMSTDTISFDDGYQLSFEDSDRKIGFVGATLAKTFVQPQANSALGTYVTATYYKDFADPTVSIFSHQTNTSFRPQRLESDNLGAYGELSVGATWVNVQGNGARARQFSASSRIDARFGDGLESVGLTGQIRWQF